MGEPFPLVTHETPRSCWDAVSALEVTDTDVAATLAELETAGNLHEIFRLDSTGIIMATKLRLFDYSSIVGQGEVGLNSRKENPMWYAPEAYAVIYNRTVEAIAADRESTS